MKPLIQAEDVAKVLNVPKERVYVLARRGQIPVVRVGRQIRFDPDRIEEWLAGGGTRGNCETG